MELTCSLCKKTTKQNEIIVTTTCGHIFHDDCIQESLKSSHTCPECHKPIKNESLLRLYLNVGDESLEIESEIKYLSLKLKKIQQLLKKDEKECEDWNRAITSERDCLNSITKQLEMFKKNYNDIEASNPMSRKEMQDLYTELKEFNADRIEDVELVVETLSTMLTEYGRMNSSNEQKARCYQRRMAELKANVRTLKSRNLGASALIKTCNSLTNNLRPVIEGIGSLLQEN
ncbi:E3 ubiquitin-protein ligase trul-1 isoform X4 [Bombyx mori]|nr:E3 ubiquitin-protein ligase TRAIP isoform X2 [Bombyx mori]XP_021209210.1 E3 ubiquitin-protein ligase TRAIP isoform X2 [Bombyx mori]XP_021209211.1 E3 ubiquitin-protein ligase TRAIP isoform X2 [Bombyx mori]